MVSVCYCHYIGNKYLKNKPLKTRIVRRDKRKPRCSETILRQFFRTVRHDGILRMGDNEKLENVHI